MSECLIMPCSDKKILVESMTPAINVFDGVLMRVVRKRAPGLDVFVCSGKYGLISLQTPIMPYDIAGGISSVLNKKFVVDKVVRKWFEITDGKPDKYETIWHVTRGATFEAIRILEKFANLVHIIPEDVPSRNNIGIILKHLKEFCTARPAFGDIDVNHLLALYQRAKSEGKL